MSRFLTRCKEEHLELSRVSPGLASRVIDEIPGNSSTKNQALNALRHFVDTLVTRGISSWGDPHIKQT